MRTQFSASCARRLGALFFLSLSFLMNLASAASPVAHGPIRASSGPKVPAGRYLSHEPKLVVVIVVDQLRSETFLEMAKSGKTRFGEFVRSSSLIPFARYQLLQSMTCPGHATILTGADPALTGIPLNDWYDAEAARVRNCVQQDDGKIGPGNLRVPTLSDTMKLDQKIGQVVSIAVKDRSAIMLAGQLGDGVFWIENEAWVTAPRYNKGSVDVPSWVQVQNQMVKQSFQNQKEKNPELTMKDALHSSFGTEVTVDLALLAIDKMKLGESSRSDHLYVSFSSHDLVGHKFGPRSDELEKVTQSEIAALEKLISRIDKKVGAKNRVIVMTSDHAVAHPEDEVRAAGYPGGRLNGGDLLTRLNDHVRASEVAKPKTKSWFVAEKTLNFYLDPKAELQESERARVLKLAAQWLKSQEGVFEVVVNSSVQSGETGFKFALPKRIADQAAQTFFQGRSGDLVVIPKPYWIDGKAKANHITSFEYDRTVPILFNGELFVPGVYALPAKVNDLVATLAFSLKVSPPAASDGAVLSLFGE